MEAGPSSQAGNAQEPGETTALLGSAASSLREGPLNHEETALGGTDSGQLEEPPVTGDDGEPVPRSAIEMLQRNIRGFVWISLILAIFLIAFYIAILALFENRPPSFQYRYGLQQALFIVTGYSVILLLVNIWSLRRRTYGSFEPWAVLIALAIDCSAAANIFSNAGYVAGWIPSMSTCGTWGKNGYDDGFCHPFQETFDGVASTWAVIGVLFALTHLILFLLHVNYLVRVFHNTRYISYDGTVASETLTSFNLVLGPFAFEFRFSVRHPPSALPSGAIREDVVRTVEQT